MKFHTSFFLFILMLLGGQSSAQSFLSKSRNLIRPGDRLVKQQVMYIAPGSGGDIIKWDFNDLQIINDRYELTYLMSEDSLLLGWEHRTGYKFRLHNDSV